MTPPSIYTVGFRLRASSLAWFAAVGCAEPRIMAPDASASRGNDGGALAADGGVHGGLEAPDAAARECSRCHAEDSAGATSPPHQAALFVTNCGQCHGQEAWRPAPGFEHGTLTLTNAHATACLRCHESDFVPAQPARACVDCHAEVANAVLEPVHRGLPVGCATCHGTDAFLPARTEHTWPLDGKHALGLCSSCHPGDPAAYAGIPSTCVECHGAEEDAANAAVTGHADFGRTCIDCHTAEEW